MTYIALIVAAVLVGVDQLIKYIVDTTMSVGDSIAVWNGVFHWTYIHNTGAAFGIFENQRWLLVGLTSVVILLLIIVLLLKKIRSPFLIWSLSLIIAGGIGNLIDRIFRHYVIDYIEVRLINFAVFNFADCCVVVGTILVVCYLLFGDLVNHRLEERRRRKHPELFSGDSALEEDASRPKPSDTVTVDWEEHHAE